MAMRGRPSPARGRDADDIVVETPLPPPSRPRALSRSTTAVNDALNRLPVQVPETPSSPRARDAQLSSSQIQSQSQSQSRLTIVDESPLNAALRLRRQPQNEHAIVPDSQPEVHSSAQTLTEYPKRLIVESDIQPTPEDGEPPEDIGSEAFAELVRVWESPPPPSSSKRTLDWDRSSRSSSATVTESPPRDRKRIRTAPVDDDDMSRRDNENRAFESVPPSTQDRVSRALARNYISGQSINDEPPSPKPQTTMRKTRPPLIVTQKPRPQRRFTDDNNPRPLRTFWTDEETSALKEMIVSFGPRWSLIKQKDDMSATRRLGRRNAGNLKDKARQMAVEYYRAGIPLPKNFDQIRLQAAEVAKLEELGIKVSYS